MDIPETSPLYDEPGGTPRWPVPRSQEVCAHGHLHTEWFGSVQRRNGGRVRYLCRRCLDDGSTTLRGLASTRADKVRERAGGRRGTISQVQRRHITQAIADGDQDLALELMMDCTAAVPSDRVDTPCWEWTGLVTRGGYPMLNRVRVHRFVLQTVTGSRLEGMEADHLCHNPTCIRPDHLRPLTPEENRRSR